nr:retrovirus-related Pol polyprotein from transposon TNT 1-94 [Tanacetum cinerariifolium]
MIVWLLSMESITMRSDSDVEEDNRTSNEFMADLNDEYHERALLANQKRFYKRSGRVGSARKHIDKSKETCFACGKPGHFQKDCPSNKTFASSIDELTKGKNDKGKGDKGKSDKGLIAYSFDWDDESVSSKDEGTTKFKAFMAIAEEEPSVRKGDARYGQWVEITMKKVHRLLSMTEEPSGASKSLISLSDLTANMADLTFNTTKRIKNSLDKVSQTYVIKKKTEPKPQAIQLTSPDKNALPSTEKLLLTLMEEVKGIKNQILIPSDTSSSVSQIFKESGLKLVFEDNSSGDTEGYGSVNCNGITFTKVAYVNGLKHNLISISQLCDSNFKVLFIKTKGSILNEKYEVILIAPRRRDVYVIDISSYNTDSNACFYAKASASVNWLWNKRLFHLNFKTINNLSKYNLVSGLPSLTFSKDKNCSVCEKGKHHRETFKTKRSFFINKCLHLLHMDLFGPVKPQTIIHNKYTLVIVDEYSRYTWVFCLKKKSDAADCIMSFIKWKTLVILRDHLGKFDEKANDGFFLGYSPVAKAFRVFNIRRQEMEETFHVTFSTLCNSNTEYFPYVPAFDRLSTINHVSPKPIITSSPLISSTSEDSSIPNSKDVVPTLDELALHVISPLADSISSPPVPQDRWSRDKHIDLVNIIGKPLAGIITRSKIRDSDVASASECLCVNFLSDIEPKRLIESLKEDGWVLAMTEELNQFKRTKARLIAKWYRQEEGIDYDETFTPVARLEAIRIFLAYTSYIGFAMYQMDVKSAFLNGKISKKVYVEQPPGFESTDCASVKCPMLPPNNLGPDESGVTVNETQFKGMIGSLMYLTASRQDI